MTLPGVLISGKEVDLRSRAGKHPQEGSIAEHRLKARDDLLLRLFELSIIEIGGEEVRGRVVERVDTGLIFLWADLQNVVEGVDRGVRGWRTSPASRSETASIGGSSFPIAATIR